MRICLAEPIEDIFWLEVIEPFMMNVVVLRAFP
jgi:hypothetical protein